MLKPTGKMDNVFFTSSHLSLAVLTTATLLNMIIHYPLTGRWMSTYATLQTTFAHQRTDLHGDHSHDDEYRDPPPAFVSESLKPKMPPQRVARPPRLGAWAPPPRPRDYSLTDRLTIEPWQRQQAIRR